VPRTENPVPLIAAELTVTAEFPVDDKVKVSVAAVFTFTAPNARFVALMLSEGTAALSCKLNDSETSFAVAVIVAVWAVLTAATDAAKLVLIAPAGMVTDAGVVTAPLLLVRFTMNPPLGAAAFSDTVQLSFPAPVIELLAQLSALKLSTLAGPATAPVPSSPITSVPVLAALLDTVTWPVVAPIPAGLKLTLKL